MHRKCVIALLMLMLLTGCAAQTGVGVRSSEEVQPMVLAVAPFANLAGNKSHDWIGVGMAEALSTKLGNLPSFQLVERIRLSDAMSEMKLGQSGLMDESSATRLGKLISAEQILTGSYQVIGNSIRVDLRIMETETGKVYKTAAANGSLDNIFEVQDRLASSLLTALGLPLAAEEKELIASKPTASPEAFRLYSQAADTYTPEGRALSDEERIDYLEQSARLDPNFTMAYMLLGDIFARNLSNYGRAVYYYQKVTYLQPNNQTARARLIRVHQRHGNHAEANNESMRLRHLKRDYLRRTASVQAERNRVIQKRRIQLRGPIASRPGIQRGGTPAGQGQANRPHYLGKPSPLGSGGKRQPTYTSSRPTGTASRATGTVRRPTGTVSRPTPTRTTSSVPSKSRSTSKSKR